jgi:hypothetical protein
MANLQYNPYATPEKIEAKYKRIYSAFFQIVGVYYSSFRRKIGMRPKHIQIELVDSGRKTLEELIKLEKITVPETSLPISELVDKMERFLRNPKKYYS